VIFNIIRNQKESIELKAGSFFSFSHHYILWLAVKMIPNNPQNTFKGLQIGISRLHETLILRNQGKKKGRD
jgi:hypothetical protein